MRFAMLEMKLALATFLYKYKVGVCSKTNHPLPLDPASFILAPKGGIWLKVTKRIGVANELQNGGLTKLNLLTTAIS